MAHVIVGRGQALRCEVCGHVHLVRPVSNDRVPRPNTTVGLAVPCCQSPVTLWVTVGMIRVWGRHAAEELYLEAALTNDRFDAPGRLMGADRAAT